MKHGRVTTYAGVLDIPEGTSGKVQVRHIVKPAGAVLQTGTQRTKLFGQPMQTQTLTFHEPTRWHELSEEDQGVWMTDLPVEQRQIDHLVARATGRVLVGGLGLGYAVAALVLKSRVKEIVVVEQSPDVIALVWPSALASVERSAASMVGRVSIVQGRLQDYLTQAKQTGERFKFGFYDIWQSDSETTFHEVVVPLRQQSDGVVGTVMCRNEDVMRSQLSTNLGVYRVLMDHPQMMVTGEKGAGLMTTLCQPTGSPYHDWSVPFWRWVRAHQGHAAVDVEYAAMRYVADYGRPERRNGLDVLQAMALDGYVVEAV